MKKSKKQVEKGRYIGKGRQKNGKTYLKNGNFLKIKHIQNGKKLLYFSLVWIF